MCDNTCSFFAIAQPILLSYRVSQPARSSRGRSGGQRTLLMPFYPILIIPDGDNQRFGDVFDPASISGDSIVYELGKDSEDSYYWVGVHNLLTLQPVVDYGLLLQNFEYVKFDNGTRVLNIDLANDIGVVTADQAVGGVLDGLTLAADYRFASNEVDAGVSQVIGGPQMADTAGFHFAGIEELTMEKVEPTESTSVIWRFMEEGNEVFSFTQAGDNLAVDYASNDAGISGKALYAQLGRYG